MWSRTLSWSSLLIGSAIVQAQQAIFQTPINSNSVYDHGLFNPVGDLSILSKNEFTTFGHPSFPEYSVRMQEISLCNETHRSFTGYIDTNDRHMFYYFFESKSNPDKDDVIFWTNGGPGCSSSLGLFMELGPCRVIDDTGPKLHPQAWNSNANVFFVDQPIGVGFSYAEHNKSVGTTEEAAKDIAAFVFIFFENFSNFKGRAFHMAGESYAGRYLPLFAAEVYGQNAMLAKEGHTPINLTSVMIGNGLTDYASMVISYYDMACTPVSFPPVLNISTCMRMKQAVPRCEKWAKKACVDHFDKVDCGDAMSFCSGYLEEPFYDTKRNPYDIRRDCGDDPLCYPVVENITDYLNLPSTQDLLGLDNLVNFIPCSNQVEQDFRYNLDQYHPTQYYIGALLERKIKVLIYVGDSDWICNHVGNEAWTLALEWSGHNEFSTQPLREWKIGEQAAGMTRSAQGLTFATIYGSGHMVPYDQPKVSLELVNRWLLGTAL